MIFLPTEARLTYVVFCDYFKIILKLIFSLSKNDSDYTALFIEVFDISTPFPRIAYISSFVGL